MAVRKKKLGRNPSPRKEIVRRIYLAVDEFTNRIEDGSYYSSAREVYANYGARKKSGIRAVSFIREELVRVGGR